MAQLQPCYALLQRRSEVQTCEGTSAMDRGDAENLFFLGLSDVTFTKRVLHLCIWQFFAAELLHGLLDLQRALFELFLFSTCPSSAIFLETLQGLLVHFVSKNKLLQTGESTSARGEIGCRKLVFVLIHPTQSHKLGILIAIANPFSTCPLLLLDTLRDPKKSLRTH